MDRLEAQTRLQLVTALAEQFGRKNSEVGLMMFVNATADISLSEFERCVMRAARESKFMPSPAELWGMSSAGLDRLTEVDRSLLAWDRVVKSIRTIGGYQTVAFDDPLIGPTIRSIATSWAALCDTESATLHAWTRKAFLEAYRAHAAGGQVTALAASPLPGLLAESRSLAGYDAPEVVLVKTRLPPSNITVLPVPEQPSRNDAVAERLGCVMQLPLLKVPDEVHDKRESKAIEDVEGKRRTSVAKLRKRGDLLVEAK